MQRTLPSNRGNHLLRTSHAVQISLVTMVARGVAKVVVGVEAEVVVVPRGQNPAVGLVAEVVPDHQVPQGQNPPAAMVPPDNHAYSEANLAEPAQAPSISEWCN